MMGDNFWPQGWLVYASAALGALDVSLIAFIITKAMRFAA